MWKNRIGYGSIVLALAVMLFYFGRPFLLGILILMLILPVIMAVLLKRDARLMQVQMKAKAGRKVGTELVADLMVISPKKLYAAGMVDLQINVNNMMFGTKEKKGLSLEPVLAGKRYQMKLTPKLCGETVIQCESAKVYDLLKLSSAKLPAFREIRTVVYPENVDLNIELDTRANGTVSEDGMILNRKGSDPSEMFDIREYIPGDDIRAIHWKLSSKTEELILRQSSATMHYQVALMPDLGTSENQTVTDAEWNTAVAVLMAAGEKLLQKGVPFCLLIPEEGKLEATEIRDRRMFRMALSQWMSSPIQDQRAEGIRYFQSAHMEQYFTRLMIVAAGREYTDLEMQSEQIRLVCLLATKECKKLQVGRWKNNMLVEIPAAEGEKETWHVIC